MSDSDPSAIILARLDALADQVAKLTATIGAKPRAERASDSPLRLTTTQACQRLNVSRKTLERAAAQGLVSQIRPSGRRGRGKPVFYLPDEIAALAVSERAAEEMMARKKRRNR